MKNLQQFLKPVSLFLFGLIFLGLLLLWSPWVTEEFVVMNAQSGMERAWIGVADGCGTNCKNCGAKFIRKTLFGALARLEFACGLIPSDSPEYHHQVIVFVSAFGITFGLPTSGSNFVEATDDPLTSLISK